jgi:hypothetical protein
LKRGSWQISFFVCTADITIPSMKLIIEKEVGLPACCAAGAENQVKAVINLCDP